MAGKVTARDAGSSPPERTGGTGGTGGVGSLPRGIAYRGFRPCRARTAALWLAATAAALALALPLAAVAAPACGRAGAAGQSPPLDDRRALPRILREQERRVDAARQKAESAGEELYRLRLRQRMLVQHGRPDLARALEADAEAQEQELSRHRIRLTDEEAALAAYRDYAVRLGVPVTGHAGTSAAGGGRAAPLP